jgi:hypothetical protein
LASSSGTVVDQSPYYPKFRGSKPAPKFNEVLYRYVINKLAKNLMNFLQRFFITFVYNDINYLDFLSYLLMVEGRHDIQHNDTQHNDTQHNDTQQNDTQQNDTQYNDTQHNDTQYDDTQHNDTQHNDIQHNNK